MRENLSFCPRATDDLHRITCHDAIPERHYLKISYTDFQGIRKARVSVYVHSCAKRDLSFSLFAGH